MSLRYEAVLILVAACSRSPSDRPPPAADRPAAPAAPASTTGAPAAAEVAVVGDAIASEALGLRVPVPRGWHVLQHSGPLGVVLQHDQHDGLFGVMAEPNPDGASLDAILDRVLEGRRQRWGELTAIERGDRALGGRTGRRVAFTGSGPRGPMRSELTVFAVGKHTIHVTCGSLESAFATVAAACGAALRDLAIAP